MRGAWQRVALAGGGRAAARHGIPLVCRSRQKGYGGGRPSSVISPSPRIRMSSYSGIQILVKMD